MSDLFEYEASYQGDGYLSLDEEGLFYSAGEGHCGGGDVITGDKLEKLRQALNKRAESCQLCRGDECEIKSEKPDCRIFIQINNNKIKTRYVEGG